jgi:uncharacterized protein YaaQ
MGDSVPADAQTREAARTLIDSPCGAALRFPQRGGADGGLLQDDQSEHIKLVIIIASDADAEKLTRKLVEQGYPATKVSSTGGFLRKGNATILSGVEANEVEGVIAMVRSECRARTEYVPVQTLPFFGEGSVLQEPIEVRTGGAIVFVMDVERFEKT